MELKNFDQIVERAKQSFRKQRVVIAGADSENILLGAFEAQDAGFASGSIRVHTASRLTSARHLQAGTHTGAPSPPL